MIRIKPVLRIIGSKYKMLDDLLPHFLINDSSVGFIDLFGGTGIVGVNVKQANLRKFVGINDYDRTLVNLNDRAIIENQLRHNGIGSLTRSASARLAKKIKNGLWAKIDVYYQVLKKVDRLYCMDYQQVLQMDTSNMVVYCDPPYLEGTRIYLHKIDHQQFCNFANQLAAKSRKVVISYSKNDWIMANYQDWNIVEVERPNFVGKAKSRTELIMWKEQSG